MSSPTHAQTPSMTQLNRRVFLAGMSGSSLALADTTFGSLILAPSRNDPIAYLLEHKLATLTAFVEAQLHALWRGCPGEDAQQVACDAIRFATYMTKPAQQALCLALSAIQFHSLLRTGHRFDRLTVSRRRQLLNQGEFRRCRHCERDLPIITWEGDYSLHTAVCSVAMLSRLVTHSRLPARRLIGFHWSAQCMDSRNLASVPAPTYPDLCPRYDVCVIGSGAGGAVIAARAAEAGKRVLIVEEGEWISPDGLVQRVRADDGQEQLWPARDDVGFTRLFQGAAVNLAGFAADPDLEKINLDDDVARLHDTHGLTFAGQLKRAKPRQMINLVQAKVVGGGPFVNNAIHLEIEEDAWHRWQDRRPPHIDFGEFWDRMQQIKQELGVTDQTARRQAGERSQVFARGCSHAGEHVLSLPVAIFDDENAEAASCAACGSDNIVDPFGSHTGGLHPIRHNGPNSYLMRALMAGAKVAYETRALKLCLARSGGSGYVRHLVAERRQGVTPNHSGPRVMINAENFVLAAGTLASTAILRKSISCNPARIRLRGLGQRLTANVATVVYAVFDKPICGNRRSGAEPGITQCYYVRRRNNNGTEEPTLENWFHYPGSLAMALTGWFDEYVSVMRKYDHLSLCGMVVPTKVRRENRIDPTGRVHLTLDQDEFELLLQGIRKICRIYLSAATPENGVTLYVPTKGILLDRRGRPARVRDEQCLEWALNEIRCRGPAFLNLATTHLQGGNPLCDVVHPETFRVQDSCGREIGNLYVADASILPAGCEVNPQLTIKALAMYAADSLLSHTEAA